MFANKAKLLVTSAALALGVALACSGASASVSISAAIGGSPTGNVFENFDSLALGNAAQTTGTGINVSFGSNGEVVSGVSNGINAAPVLSLGNGANFGPQADGIDTTHYLTTGTSSITFDFSSLGDQSYVGFLWGSVDLYNSLAFYENNVLVGSLTGADVNAAANGAQDAGGTYYVNINSTTAFNKIIATSSDFAFEIDNMSLNSAGGPGGQEVPEPASLALFGLGMLGLGIAARRRK